jgi:hypothetical protein
MKLILQTKDFEHIKDESIYNHNIYKYLEPSSVDEIRILEVCHEDDNFYEYHMITNGMQSFLGCSPNPIDNEHGEVEIDFQLYYT